MSYEKSVFINCPFDSDYQPLFDAILFAVFVCGFIPRCALEEDNGGEVRIEKIKRIISESKIGIHDISRTELDGLNELPRFNMPLELGLFLGAAEFGGRRQKEKKCLVFDVERHRYQKFMSDIAGQDIKAHARDPEQIIRHVRNVLNALSPTRSITGAKTIIDNYRTYQACKPDLAQELGWGLDELTYTDECALIERWVALNV